MLPYESQGAGKNIYKLHLKKDGQQIIIRSNFDSGNLSKIEFGLNNSIIISPANDCSGTQYESHAKGWFHFAVSGFVAGTRQKFVVKRMNQLGGGIKFSDYFKPVFKYGSDGSWERIQNAVTFNKEDDTELHFQFHFQRNIETYFAYAYPFSFEECEKLLKIIKNQAKLNKNIYYHDEVIINSIESRPIHLITISSQDKKLTCKESPIDEKLFPGAGIRAFKFQQEKKVILISARVHPGQAPSSHTMNGILRFLVSKDARAELLRKNFVVKLIPMLNPDGVYHGHYRMDTLNQNLNRFYLQPDFYKQPSSFALKKLGEYFKLQNRLCFFIDLHAHPQKKGNFIYGNSIDKIEQQIQTQVFPKILSLNCVEFDYENSCFSKNHMNFKDRNEDFTKQGCSRVVFHKELGVIYSYTMQCGYTMSNYYNELNAVSNPHRKVEKQGIILDELDNIKSAYYNQEKKKYLTIKSYENLGRCILISILDLFQLNPYSRLPNGDLKNLQEVRNFIRDSLVKASKESKVYSNKFTIHANTNHALVTKRVQKIVNNQTFTLGRTLPKPIIGLFEKKIVTSKIISKTNDREKDRQKERRKTLPKMKSYNK